MGELGVRERPSGVVLFGIQPDAWLAGLAIFGGLTIPVVLYWLFGFTCPQCHTRRGLEGAGTRLRKGRFLGTYKENRYRCRSCGHIKWRRAFPEIEGGD